MLGNQNENEQSYVTEPSLQYFTQLKSERDTSGLDEMFKLTSDNLKILVKGMLEFNPHFRFTAEQCLKSPIFDDLRVKELEQPSNVKLNLAQDAIGAYDYDLYEDKVFKNVH